MKRIFTVLLSALLLVGMLLPLTASAEEPTIPVGYIPIYTVEDMAKIRSNLSGKYILMADLDFSKASWTPIGYMSSRAGPAQPIDAFSGVFDGNGHVIWDLSASASSLIDGSIKVGGLFGCAINATIKNLGLANCGNSFNGNIGMTPTSYTVYVGGIVGFAYGATIQNCFVTGSVSGDTYAGGIAAYADHSTIKECYNGAAISSVDFAGGVAGYMNYTYVEDCYNYGMVSETGSIPAMAIRGAGGIAGRATQANSVARCYNTGQVSGAATKAKLGGIVGEGLVIETCYYLDSSAAVAVSNCPDRQLEVNAFVRVKALTHEQMLLQESFTGFSFSKSGPWAMPTLTEGYPVLLKTPKMLFVVRYDANGGTGAPEPQTKQRGTALALSVEQPVREGYDFLGWSVNPGAEAAEYAPGGNYDENADGTLYAVWSAIPTYTVIFNANGGTGAPEPQTKQRGDPLTLSGQTPVKEGYTFLGWGQDSTVLYAPGSEYTADADITLTAVWEATQIVQQPWWADLPTWVQWILRILCFGWIWMK